MELHLIKSKDGALRAVDQESEIYIAKLKYGSYVKGEFKKPRNGQFHRKLMALFRTAYEFFEETYEGQIVYKGQPVAANFERFRKDLTIRAGHYDVTFNLLGEMRLEAKSLSFGSMDDAELEQVYSDVINAALKDVYRGEWSDKQLRDAVNAFMEFDK